MQKGIRSRFFSLILRLKEGEMVIAFLSLKKNGRKEIPL